MLVTNLAQESFKQKDIECGDLASKRHNAHWSNACKFIASK